jgi:hypothetical protein
MPPLMEYWVPEVGVTGLHELVANALNPARGGERTTDLRGEPLREWRVMMPKNKKMYNKGLIVSGLAVFLVLPHFLFGTTWEGAPGAGTVSCTRGKGR